jgi:flagellar biosynthesis protein FlhF
MRLKLYRAASVAEAMERVRVELGNDALIIGTRRVGEGMEVTAALETEPLLPADAASRAALEFHGVPPVLRDALQMGELVESLADVITFSPLPLAPGSAPLLLVGPPGAGKTLTVARLATRLVMAGGSPKVITADGKRAGAVEQLAAFTSLLGIKQTIAHQPQSISRALAGNAAPTLIDTAGSDPFDASQCDEVRELARAAGALTVLVLPAGLDAAEAADLAEAYRGLGATFLVVTRIDVTRRLGGMLAAAAVPGLALSEAGVGPGAADGLRPIDPPWLAERLLAIPSETRA